MLNFNNTTLIKLNIENEMKEKNKPTTEQMKFYNSLYNKKDLSDYILVDKKPRKSKNKNGNYSK